MGGDKIMQLGLLEFIIWLEALLALSDDYFHYFKKYKSGFVIKEIKIFQREQPIKIRYFLILLGNLFEGTKKSMGKQLQNYSISSNTPI